MITTQTLQVKKFEIWHVGMVKPLDDQEAEYEAMHEMINAETEFDSAWSGFNGNRCFGCTGIHKKWPGSYYCWFLFDKRISTREFLFTTRAVKSHLDNLQSVMQCRIEVTVKNDYEHGHRWAKRLGFEKEGVMKCYDPFRNDHAIYARVS